MDQPGKVANPARGQLNRENNIPLSPCVPENYGRDEVVLHEAAAKNISVLGIQETRRPGRTVSTAA